MKKDKFREKFLKWLFRHVIRHFVLEDEVLLISKYRIYMVKK